MLETAEPFLSVRDLRMEFRGRGSLVDLLLRRRPGVLVALDGVSLDVARGEAVGIVGESGCGKSTLARCLVGLYEPTAGEIRLGGSPLQARRRAAERRRIQIVFQDPYSSLNPRLTAGEAVREVLKVHRIVPPSQVDARVRELFGLVGLSTRLMQAYPRRLSGGQRQRVSIARALAPEAEILVADEPVSALDVSVQATVLNLLADLRQQLGLTLVFISHDLSVVRHVCDRVAVMYLGRIVEQAAREELFTDARHPYSKSLLAAAPSLTAQGRPEWMVAGDPPSAYELPSGCRYHPRCPISQAVCHDEDPPLLPHPEIRRSRHAAACHFAWTPERPTPHPAEIESTTRYEDQFDG